MKWLKTGSLIMMAAIALTLLYFCSLYNYLLFHSIVEIFSVCIAITVFFITWNSRNVLKNNYLLLVGIAYLFIGILDFFHTMGYPGMSIFKDYNYYANELWIAARYFESIALLLSFIIIKSRKQINSYILVAVYFVITAAILLSVFVWHVYPECFIEGVGQTPFKILSEYIIILIFIAAILMLRKNRNAFENKVYKFLLFSLISMLLTELSFTTYVSNYGFTNLLGHYFKIISFYLVYKAVIQTGIREPYNLIFREIKQKETELFEILDSSADGSCIVDNINGTFDYSEKWLKRIGAESISNKELLKYMEERIHPDDSERAIKERLDAIRSKKSRLKIEYRTKTAEGDYIWVMVQGKLIYDENGNFIKYYGTVTDITDQKNAEETLKKSEELLKAALEIKSLELQRKDDEYLEILDGITEGNYIYDFITGKTRYSTSWTKRLGLDDALPDQLLERFHEKMEPEEAEENTKIRQDLQDSNEMQVRREFKVRDIDGRMIWVMSIGKLIYDSSGKLIKTYGTFIDITDRKKMELELKHQAEVLRKKNRLITDFFTNVSHGFKTPLAVMLIQLELMKMYISSPEKLKGCISTTTHNIYRLSRLVSNILDITKYDAGFMKLNLTNMDVVALIKDIFLYVESYANAKNIKMTFETAFNEKTMPVDADKLERIILNLLSNSIKHTEKGGIIKLRVGEGEGDGISISVEDTGEGIPEELFERIFDRFEQVDTSLTRKNDGCGIGLSIVKAFIDLFGGSIDVISKVGFGSTFTVSIPKMDASDDMILVDGFDINNKVAIELSDLDIDNE